MRWLVRLMSGGGILLQKIELVSLDYHMIPGTVRSARLPSTASATARFGLGVGIAFAAALLASRTDFGRMRTVSLAEKGFRRLVLITVS